MPQLQVAELTYILDKFPCIQGIAELFKNVIGCAYLAGHWELSLIESLDWMSPLPHNMPSYTNTTPVAPSWSLASVHGKTWYKNSHQGSFPVAEFLGASSTTMSDGPITVRDLCRLRIKGPAHRLGMDINEVIIESTTGDTPSLSFFPGSSWLPGHWPPENDVTHWTRVVPIYADSHQSYKMEASIHIHDGNLVTVREDSALFLVILIIFWREHGLNLSGIVTRQVSEESDGPVLERIGNWHSNVPDSELAHFAGESFREGMKQLESTFYLV